MYTFIKITYLVITLIFIITIAKDKKEESQSLTILFYYTLSFLVEYKNLSV